MMLARLVALFRRTKVAPAPPTRIGGLEFRVRSLDEMPGWVPPAERREAWLRSNVDWIDREMPIMRRDRRDVSVNLLDY